MFHYLTKKILNFILIDSTCKKMSLNKLLKRYVNSDDDELSTTDSFDDLKRMYWIEGLSLTQISYLINYESTRKVADKLKEWRIPLRPIDIAKDIIELNKQNDDTTNLRGSALNTDGQTITTEAIDFRDYRNFQAFISFGETGTATSSTITITAQFTPYSSVDTNTVWFDYEEGPWSFPIESAATIPRNFVITGLCLARYIRFTFLVEANSGTLNGSNYFTIGEVYVGVS